MARIDANDVAAVGWLSPMRSSLLHNGSTVAILLSALAAASQQERPQQNRRGEEDSAPGRFVF